MPVVVNLSGVASASPFWQSLLASAITSGIAFAGALAVVWLSNKYASANLRAQRKFDETRYREQREHEAAEAVKDRTTQKRRDVCLNAVDTLARFQAHLATLATRFDDYDNQPLQSFVAAAAQAELVVEPQTALAVRQLVTQVGQLQMKLMIKRIPLYKLHKAVAKAKADEKERLTVKPSSAELESQFQSEQISFYRYMLEGLPQLIPTRVAALVAVRGDLELTAEDPESLQAYWVRDGEEIVRLFKELIAELQR